MRISNHFKRILERHERSFAIAIGASLLTAFLMNLEFNWIESSLYDFRMRTGSQPAPSTEIALIAIDDPTLAELDEISPIPLDYHVRLMETLETLRPRSVGYLVDLNRTAQTHPQQLRGEWGERFVNSASRLKNSGIPFLLGTSFDINGEVIPPFPLSVLPHAVSLIHKDGNVFGEDKITRRALLRLYGKPSFHLEYAKTVNSIETGERGFDSVPGAFTDPSIDASYFFFKYRGPTGYGARVAEEAQSKYKIHSMIDVIEGRIPRSLIQDKIVLVGSVSRNDPEDFALTPYSRRAFANPKLIVHANILDAIQNEDGVLMAPEWLNWVSTFLLSAFVIWSVFTYTPLYGVFSILILAAGFLAVGQILFSARGLWIRESQPLVGIFLAYYLSVPYRLIQEYKRRWDYQRKNEILVQVEELKTNFLRLVTHDLKTPVARIQGLAEMVLRRAPKRLEEPEIKNLEHIVQSTDELNRFITSILELTKVESNQLTLRLESKDVNRLIEETQERFDAQSRTMGIRLRTELEPLFPIRIDASLISKVLANVIDNAMKYSPRGSEVWIKTIDRGDDVVISVKDQGVGLSEEELQNLFTRFYRAKNDQTAKTSGTGLGLYLTKFFVEAHQGSVEVESSPGEGSIFTITLPVDLKDESVTRPGLSTRLPSTERPSEKGVPHA